VREIDNPTPAQSGSFGAAITAGSGRNVLIGAPGQDHAYVFDGSTGALVESLAPTGLSSPNYFGFAVASNFITAPFATINNQTRAGALFTGTKLLLAGASSTDRLGVTLASIGGAYLVGDEGFPQSGSPHEYGRVLVGYDYATNYATVLQAPTPVDSAFFGVRMAALGGPWVVIGDNKGTNFVFLNGVLNRTFPGAGRAEELGAAGDVDGDGLPELLMVNGTNGAAVLSLKADPPVVLAQLDYPSTERFVGPSADFGLPGVTLAGLGDIDKDGVPDVLAGSPALDVGANKQQGRVFLFLSGRAPAQP
jgi:hypothetical protein